MYERIFICGIDTDAGKTVASSIFVEAFKADYWKPIQAGNLELTDTDVVKSLVSNSRSYFHEESYVFKMAASPHAAAEAEDSSIDLKNIIVPDTDNMLIIEGAGGLMVPLNDQDLLIDLIVRLESPVILVSRNYLGSINHTLLSIEALMNRNIDILGIVFNGEENVTSQEIITYSGLDMLSFIDLEDSINKEVIARYARIFRKNLKWY